MNRFGIGFWNEDSNTVIKVMLIGNELEFLHDSSVKIDGVEICAIYDKIAFVARDLGLKREDYIYIDENYKF